MVYPDGGDSKVEDYDKENASIHIDGNNKKRKVCEVVSLVDDEIDDIKKGKTVDASVSDDDEIIFVSSTVVAPHVDADVIVID